MLPYGRQSIDDDDVAWAQRADFGRFQCLGAVAGNGGGTLPSPWIEMPVGKIEPLGSTRQRDSRFVLSATSGDLWGDQEIFNFVFRTLEGDFAFTARIAERIWAPGSRWGKVGVMARATFDRYFASCQSMQKGKNG